MEKYIINFGSMREIDNFLWEVKNKTRHWKIPPKIRMTECTIEFGNALIYLSTNDKYAIGRHDLIRVSPTSVLYTIMIMNEKLRLGYQGIFDK